MRGLWSPLKNNYFYRLTENTCSIWTYNGAELLERPDRLLSLVRFEVIQLYVLQPSRHVAVV